MMLPLGETYANELAHRGVDIPNPRCVEVGKANSAELRKSTSQQDPQNVMLEVLNRFVSVLSFVTVRSKA